LLLVGLGEIAFFGATILVCGLALAGFGVFKMARRSPFRDRLTVYEEGLVVSRQGSDKAIPYSQVQGLSLVETRLHREGIPAGVLRRMDFLWPGERLHFAQSSDTADDFKPVVTRLLERLANEAEAKLAAGASLSGDGWALDSQGLRVGKQAPVKLEALTCVGRFSGKVSFWRAEERQPFFMVPVGSINARLLDVLARRRSSKSGGPGEGELGRLLFQKGGLSVHEGGVTERSLFSDRRLLYSQIKSFQFGGVRQFVNGNYRGTWLNIRFTADPDGPEIAYGEGFQGGDLDLDLLREHVTHVLADRFLERLHQGDKIRWGSSALFTREGLEVWEPRPIDSGMSRHVRYEEGFQYVSENGTFSLYIGDETEAATSFEFSATNFYPGFEMLNRLSPIRSRGLRVTG
jgi:hypothetical protein